MTHEEWLNSVIGDDSMITVAEKVDLSDGTLRGQLKRNGRLSSNYILLIADAYAVHPVQALADTGYIDQRYVNPHVKHLTNEELLDEMRERMI